jgi:Domain of unknown function (DUF222)/HNH endonuclease
MKATRLQALESELALQQAHMNAAMARWLGLLAELDGRGDLAGDPFERWVAWRFGVSFWEAAELVRVARALRELPAIRAAFDRGELTLTKVRSLTRVATPACEERLLQLACALTAPQLARALRVYQRVSAAQAGRQHELEYVSYYWDDDGSLVLHARLASEDGTLLIKALDAARERIRERRRHKRQTPAPPARTAPPPVEAPRSERVEALLELAQQSLDPERKRQSSERAQLFVHVDATTITNGAQGRCELDDGPVISPETARRLGCDATTITITKQNGAPLTVGRKRRTVPPKLRQALEARDHGTCQWPGCTNRHYLDAHHRRHWAHGGETSLGNLILLCWHHHRLVHEGGYTIHADPNAKNGIHFKNRHGVAIATAPRSPPGNADALADYNHQAGVTITDETNRNGTLEPRDLGQTVDALSSIVG